MKTCFKCKQSLPLTDFYPHPRMADGHLNKCKPCAKQDVAARSAKMATDPAWLDSERARGVEKYHRLYSAGPNWKAPVATAEQKRQANNAVNNAVRDGRLVKPKNCEDCGTQARVSGHHEDYAAPLAVAWLCSRCHRVRHAEHPDRVRGS